eukprot:m.35394 g.35394  ORF g.35394 m.35394 type:complete len:154 (+) comp8878_c0_seq1:142-603(+)
MPRASFNVENPNASSVMPKGFLIWYTLMLVMVHLVILSLPFSFLTKEWVWTLTNLVHTCITFSLFHWVKGSPVPTIDSENSTQTQWEQIAGLESKKMTRVFLRVVPFLLFWMSIYKADHDEVIFLINLVLCGFCIIPKLPLAHNVRIFNWNKY